jgi:protein arginine N-methyltransferase 1
MDDLYTVSDYGQMIADRVRMDAYAYALKEAIGRDSVVLDIGAATGIHSLLACKFGARRVFAVEPNDAIELARELAEANGFSDRIEFIQDTSTNVSLPERVDVVVSDLRGQLPLFGRHIPSIVDARERHLAPGGTLIPVRDTLWVALVEARRAYGDIVDPWDEPYGLRMDAARRIAVNTWTNEGTDTIDSRSLLTEPRLWAEIDYRHVESPDVARPGDEAVVTRPGTAHGLLVWFDAELGGDIAYSNGPGTHRAAFVYGRGFFPLTEPVPVDEGDVATLALQATLGGDGDFAEYCWSWQTRIASPGPAGRIKADFTQSTDLAGTVP